MTTPKQTKKTATNKTSKTTAITSVEKVEAAVKEATAEASQTATSFINTVNETIENARTMSKQAWLASLGVFGRSVEEVQGAYSQANKDLTNRYSKINEDGQKLVQDLVVRGEKVQGDAEVLLKEGRANVEQQIELAKNRMTGLVSVIDIPARLQKISDKLEALSKDLKKAA